MMQLAVMWISHISIILWTVRFPLHALEFTASNRMKYIHGVIVISALVIPIASIAGAFATGGFINARFPPLLCLPKSSDTAYYALVLPISIIMPCGVSLLLIILWTIQKVNRRLTFLTACILHVNVVCKLLILNDDHNLLLKGYTY